MRAILRRWWRAVRAWWIARREFRRSMCTWCDQPLWLVDQPPVLTEYTRQRVHLDCKWPADEDQEASLW